MNFEKWQLWPKNVITQILQSLYNFISTLAIIFLSRLYGDLFLVLWLQHLYYSLSILLATNIQYCFTWSITNRGYSSNFFHFYSLVCNILHFLWLLFLGLTQFCLEWVCTQIRKRQMIIHLGMYIKVNFVRASREVDFLKSLISWNFTDHTVLWSPY